MKISALAAATVALSVLAVPVAEAGGKPIGSDFHSGASAATSGQSQRQNRGHVHNYGHLSGTQHRGGHKGGAHKGAAPIHIICSPYCEGG